MSPSPAPVSQSALPSLLQSADHIRSQQPSPAARSHYRPFSTLLTQEPQLHLTPLAPGHSKKRKYLHHRSSSALSVFGIMGFSLKDIVKDKDCRPLKTSDIVVLHPSSPRPIRTSTPEPSLLVHPPSPSVSTSTSPSRFSLHRVKKKRSLASLLSDHTRPSTPDFLKITPPLRSASSNEFGTLEGKEDDDGEEDWNTASPRKYVEKNKWLHRRGTQLHPYTLEAPYMQSYDPIMLENDHYTDTLLLRLNPNGTPSFHDYGHNPPAVILDMGCGQGHWILQAATAWKSSQIIGFDLVDVTLPVLERMENVAFVRGNFLKYTLPFPDNHFDMVRMANLALCIPYERWEFVLEEVRRVLKLGGRLELIDDQIHFPYGEASSISEPATPTTPFTSRLDDEVDFLDVDDDDDTLEDDNDDDTSSTVYDDALTSSPPDKFKVPPPLLLRDESPLSASFPSLFLFSSIDDPDTPTSATTTHTTSTLRPSSWAQQAGASRELETIFVDMLKKKYGIHPHPSEFLLDLLKLLFGRPTTNKLHSFHLKVAPTNSGGSFESHRNLRGPESPLAGGTTASRKPGKSSLEKQGRNSLLPSSSLPQIPDKMSAKAADRLGISYSALAVASTSGRGKPSPSLFLTPSTRSSSSRQPPGLILWPSTFIPLSPLDLEMHATKHIHTLLGSKAALAGFISSFMDENGKRIASDDEFEESLWKYECFRRQRFRWPSAISKSSFGLDEKDDPFSGSPTGSSSGSSSPLSTNHGHHANYAPYAPAHPLSEASASSFNFRQRNISVNMPKDTTDLGEQLTHVRTIRVWEAIKHVAVAPNKSLGGSERSPLRMSLRRS